MKKAFVKQVECKTCGQVMDSPTFDYTEQAHPAWWRGHEAGINAACEKIMEVLDFKWDGSGVLDIPALDQIRIKVRQLQTAYEREALKVSFCGEATMPRKEELEPGQLGWSKSYREVQDLRKDRDKLLSQLRTALTEIPEEV